MNLDSLERVLRIRSFPVEDEIRRPSEDDVRELRRVLQEGLRDDAFVLDILEKELEVSDRAPWIAPFHVNSEFGVRFALAYWAPGHEAGPHEHSDWTVTAILHNRLAIQTFDVEATIEQRCIVPKNLFIAEAGQVGHIYRLSIHNPRNVTPEWAISLHVIGPHDRAVLARTFGPIRGLGLEPMGGGTTGDPLEEAIDAYLRECVRRVQIDALAARGEGGRALINRVKERGDHATRWHAARALGYPHGLNPGAPITRRWPNLALEAQERGEHAELRARSWTGASRTLVRVERTAMGAMEYLAAVDSFVSRDIPDLDTHDQRAISEALIRWGIFQPAE